MKTKNEFLGTTVTTYHGNYERTFTITEETAKEHKYYTSIGLGHLFEESTPKAKYKGVDNEDKKEKDSEA